VRGYVYQIGQLAQRTGLSADAIRFYEKAGLLPRPARSSGGYRLYGEHEIADLEFIQKAQQLGFSLNEIREFSSIQRRPDLACAHVRDLIAQKLTVVRGKIGQLRVLETSLADALKQCSKALQKRARNQSCCPVLQGIAMAKSERERL
jgi:MerR family mercuric resistance operon transcriptional regulator